MAFSAEHDAHPFERGALIQQLSNTCCSAHNCAQMLLFCMQACANAEAAYTRTLTAASKVKLVGDCDGASVRGALDGFSDLPFMVGQASLLPIQLSDI
jgi:hypothetical protein